MDLIRWDPFREFDLLQQQFLGNGRSFASASTTDIYTVDDRELVIETHLPNFKSEEIALDINNGALEIRAEHRERQEDNNRKYMLRESSASYYRRIALPKNVDENAIVATFEDGVLKVRLPYKELPRPTRVEIGSETSKKSHNEKRVGKS